MTSKNRTILVFQKALMQLLRKWSSYFSGFIKDVACRLAHESLSYCHACAVFLHVKLSLGKTLALFHLLILM